jgi:hypothetical protein
MRVVLSTVLLIVVLSCNFEKNCSVEGIIVQSSVINQAQKLGFPYCLTFRKALKKDETALLQLIRFAYKTDDISAIDHGIAFSELSVKLGDKFMSSFISKQKDEHRLLIAKMFDACLEFREPDLNLKKELPLSIQALRFKE